MEMEAANGNPFFGIALGALIGVFIGWFIAAVAIEKRNTRKTDK
jgi:hypothetical protein